MTVAFRHETVAPEIHLCTYGEPCPSSFELFVYRFEPGVPVETQVMVRADNEPKTVWRARVLRQAKVLQDRYPVPRGKSVVVIKGAAHMPVEWRH